MSIRPLSPELAEKARLEINEDPKRIPSDIQHIKDWLSKQPHLRARTEDQFIVSFLRGCKYSLEKTKKKIDLFYSLRSVAPELFQILPKDPFFREVLELGSYLILPNSTAFDNSRVSIVRPGKFDATKYKLLDIVSASNLMEKVTMMDDDLAMIAGRCTIIDLEGVSMAHLKQMTPSTMKKMSVLKQDSTSMRFKGAHYINVPAGFDVIFNAMRSLLNEKTKSRFFVHNKNYEEMYKYISKDMLPVEYGGTSGTIGDVVDYWIKKVDEYGSWLEEDLKYGSDEAKRPGKPNTAADVFGIEGSFRKLELD